MPTADAYDATQPHHLTNIAHYPATSATTNILIKKQRKEENANE